WCFIRVNALARRLLSQGDGWQNLNEMGGRKTLPTKYVRIEAAICVDYAIRRLGLPRRFVVYGHRPRLRAAVDPTGLVIGPQFGGGVGACLLSWVDGLLAAKCLSVHSRGG